MNYINNTEITTFILKAQNKIADLATELVNRGGDDHEILHLLLALSDFIECLDSPFTNWKERDILRWTHEYNQRADLNSIPFYQITSYITEIVTGNGGINLPITVADISDYVPTTNQLIRATPHNLLNNLQGGNSTERYHITKEMYDFLYNLIHPFVAPTVGLSILPTGYQEKGITISAVDLQGSYALNGGGSILSYRYKRLGRTPSDILTSGVGSTIPSYTSHEDVTVDTTFRFEATFQTGGIKTADQTLRFVPPIYYGVALKGASIATIKGLTKLVEAPSNGKSYSFTLPSNNTTVPTNQIRVPYLLLPKVLGTPARMDVATFNTINDWTITSVVVTLANGLMEDYWRCEFNNTVTGTFITTVTTN